MSSEFTGRVLHVTLRPGRSRSRPRPSRSIARISAGPPWVSTTSCATSPPGTDGLDPANVLTMMGSLLTGAPIAGQSRITISARSPLTDGIGDSQGGGFFPAELRFAGFTGIVVKGRSPEPVYLWVHDGEAELRPVGHLWGTTTSQVTDLLKAELDDKRIEVALIGPAGEKLSRLAAVMSMGNRANGRTGMGAVMGSKNLKAVAVRGTTRKVPMVDAAAFGRLAKWGAKEIPNNGDVLGLRTDGTEGVLEGQHAAGGLPTFNYSAGQFEGNEAIGGPTMTATILTDRDTCDRAPCAASAWSRPSGRAARWSPGTVARSTRRPPSSAPIAAWTTSTRSRWPTRFSRQPAGPGHDRHRGDRRLGHGLLRAGRVVRGGDRVPRPVRRHGCDGAPDGPDRGPEGIGDVLANGSRRAASILGKGEEYLITVKGAEGACRHAAGEAVSGRDLRRQPVRRRPPVVRARWDDRGRCRRSVHGAA